MLWIVMMVAVVLWVTDGFGDFAYGGFWHIVLLVALEGVFIQVLEGKRPL